MTDTYFYPTADRATILKDPQAVLDYTFDWSEWLEDPVDTIISKTLIASSVTIDSSSIAADFKSVTVWVSGGAIGNSAYLNCQIVTAGGRIDERTIYFQIRNR